MDNIELRKEHALKALLLELSRATVRASSAIGLIAAEHPENESLLAAVEEMSKSSSLILEKIGDYFDLR